jgi:catechol 2,3-dioxygenase
MNTTPLQAPTTAPSLPASLRLGPVRLSVSDLDRSVGWYQRALGLRIQRLDPPVAELGDGSATVLELREDPAARRAGRHAGLYHYALLYPSRQELARAAVRLAATHTPIQGASDHGTHEAIYLPDPDGLGIELAADRPRELWPTPEEEFGRGGPRPLEIENLLATVAGEEPRPHVEAGVRVGHLHLHVGSIGRGLAFYRNLVGFEAWALLPSAAFVSAGGYHHHLGFNTWLGEGVPPAPPDTVGLRDWTIELGGQSEVAAVRSRLDQADVQTEDVAGGFRARDPWEIALRVVERKQ